MVSKTAFISKCLDALMSSDFTDSGAKATIHVMSNLKLKDIADSETVPSNLIQECIDTLAERVKLMKGEEQVSNFLAKIKKSM